MAAEAVPYGRVTQKKPAVADVHIVWITAGLGCGGTVANTPGDQTLLAFQLFLARLKLRLFQCQSGLSFLQLCLCLVTVACRLLNPLLGILDRSDGLLV
jgi:hypothetical protein